MLDYNRIEKIIEDDHLEEALELLKKKFPQDGTLIELKGRLSGLSKKKNKGVIPYEQERIEKNEIRSLLIEWVKSRKESSNKSEEERPKPLSKPKANQSSGDSNKTFDASNSKKPLPSLTPFQKFIGTEIFNLIEELNQHKINTKPKVNGVDLLAFEGNIQALINFLQRYTVLQSLDDLRRILYWKLNVLDGGNPMSGIKPRQAEQLFLAVFGQDMLQKSYQKRFEETGEKIKVVLFRRGRHLRDLTNLLRTFPFVSLKIVVSGTDEGESWYEAARAFQAPGIPGAAKALLDLCEDRAIRDFLKIRLSASQSKEFYTVLKKMKDSIKYGSPSDEDDTKVIWTKGMRIPRKDRIELIELLEYADEAIEKIEDRPKGLTKEGLTLRNLLLLGAGLSQSGWKEGKLSLAHLSGIDWQAAIQRLYGLLKIKKHKKETNHSEVILPSKDLHQMIGIRQDGYIYFSEVPINYHDNPNSFSKIWLKNRVLNGVDIEKILEDIRQEMGIEIKRIDYEQENWKKMPTGTNLSPEVIRKQITESAFKLVDQHDLPNLIAAFDNLNSSTSSDRAYDISNAAMESIKSADIVIVSGKQLETNVAGALLTYGMREAISASSALKICLPDILEAEDKSVSAIFKQQLNPICKYLSRDFSTSALDSLSSANHQSFFDYVLAAFPDWSSEKLNSFAEWTERKEDSVFGRHNRQTGLIGVDASQMFQNGFFSSTLLIDAIFSLFEIRKVGNQQKENRPYGFKLTRNGSIVPGAFINAGIDLRKSSLGLFRNSAGIIDSDKKERIEELIEGLKTKDKIGKVSDKGAMVFDVDMTILPSGSNSELDRYQYMAHLFTRLLREGIRIAIISGNSEQKQMDRVYRAIRNEMQDDPSAFANLTFYVNGGGTKIKFNEKGRKYYDENYNEAYTFKIHDYEKDLKEILKNAAKRKFDLNEEEIEELKKKFDEKFAGFSYLHTSLEDPENWTPMVYSEEEIASLKNSGTPIAYPWIEMRGLLANSDIKNEKAGSISIRPLPNLEVKTTSKGTESLRVPRLSIIEEMEEKLDEKSVFKQNNYYIGPAGRSTIDIAVGKTNAIQDFIKTNPQRGRLDTSLNTDYVYYFGDEFYTLTIQKKKMEGNDQKLAHENIVKTIALNEKMPIRGISEPSEKTIWIGRTPQALLEFLEAILLVIQSD